MLYRPAFLLGYAGLIPAFAALGVAAFAPPEWRELAFRSGALYAGLILSFLGGAWWGLATRAGPERAWPLYILAVIPSLAALVLLLLLTPWRLVLLGGLIALTLPVDRLLLRLGLAPANWMQLRVPLTIGLSLATAGLGLLAT
ncbi:MAG: DUF3429 domain-containing protein [Sandarakinorhabdus sp.]|nr:DUF3429 domain-containing protein [Sandarakinorhabdus sp.]